MPEGGYNQIVTLIDRLAPEEKVRVLDALLVDIETDPLVEALEPRKLRLLQSLGRELVRLVDGAQTVAGARPNPTQPTETFNGSSTPVSAGENADVLARSNLTRAQFLMWTGQQIYPDLPLYSVADSFHIHGAVDLDTLQRAFDRLVADTDILRTVMLDNDGVPAQMAQEKAAGQFAYCDLSGEADPQAAYRTWLDDKDGIHGTYERTLFQATLLKLADDEYIWHQVAHHAITDATSSDILFRRLAVYYDAAQEGRLSQLPPPPQFADFVRHERELRGTPRAADASTYWAEKCASPVPRPEFYGSPPADTALRAARVTLDLGPTRSQALNEIAAAGVFASRSRDLSLYSAFATVLLATLYRLTGQTEQRIGTLYNGRPTAAFQETAGLFIEMGVLLLSLDRDDSFASIGKRVMAETMAGLAHIHPGMTTAEINRSVDVVLNFVQSSSPAFGKLPVTREPIFSGYIDADHSLRLWVTDFAEAGQFTLTFDMKAAVFGEAERNRFVQNFLQVLDALIEGHEGAVGDISLLTPAEHQRLVVDFNATDAPYPETTVVPLFEAQVARSPQAVAAADGDRTITYAELNVAANRLAHYLRDLGVGPEAPVALCMERSIDVLVATWGVLKAGGAFVPVDPAYPADRIAYMIADAGAQIVLLGDGIAVPQLSSTEDGVIIRLRDVELSSFPATDPVNPAEQKNLAYMIYTSGSTGRPKGVMLTHQGLLNYVWWARRIYQAGEVLDFPLYSSLAFDLTITTLFVPLLSGGRIVIYSESAAASGLEIMDVFRDDAVDIVKLTPSHLALLRKLDLSAMRIRKLIVGGEDFKTELARSVHDAFGGRVEIYNEYGPTEAVVGCMIHRYDVQRDRAASVPIGEPAANARIYLLDDFSRPVPPGVTGEIVIGGHGVARGYHQMPELTAERFLDDPFRPGERIYRSGDLARWTEDGQIVFLGRRDHQVKLNGARIELGEIEARLTDHPGVRDALVVVTAPGRSPDPDDVVECTLCGLPSNHPDVTFDESGVCSLCRDFDRFRDDVFRYFKTMDDLQEIVACAKRERTGVYDCMLLYSGGKDSTYVLGQLVEMGLEVLAFTLDNGYISEEAKENMRQITDHLGVDLVMATTPHMNAIFADSLRRHSNVCQGCYKVIYTLSMNLAREKGIRYIFTGLSRGQLFETRLDELFRNRIFDVAEMDAAVLEARKLYHRVDDAANRLLDVSMFNDDKVFGEIEFVDFFRYTDVELDELYDFLATRVPWKRPQDTGRSTNCLINEAGIFVHQAERGYHNYALPYSWDVRLGHKTREEALEELKDDLRLPMVQEMLDEVGYSIKTASTDTSELRLAAYVVPEPNAPTGVDLRTYLAESLPDYMVPTYLVELEEFPLTPNGKIDRARLPDPGGEHLATNAVHVAPESDLEVELASIWTQTLGSAVRLGVHDDFFDLGGASIPAVQVVAHIREQFGVDFSVGRFFECPTIAQQAEIIEELLLAQLEEMSDADLDALLLEMGE